ncbi:hypothetical protein MP638_002092 [Amoeboaphelidium occidentale]|nr:hypothetical protein MP638_002092 [Amoeboaphelidium occidentale]
MPPMKTFRDKNSVEAEKLSSHHISFDASQDGSLISDEEKKSSKNAPESEFDEDGDFDDADMFDLGPGLDEDTSNSVSDEVNEPAPMTDEQFKDVGKNLFKASDKKTVAKGGVSATEKHFTKLYLRFCHEALRRDHKFYRHMCKVKFSSRIIAPEKLKRYLKPRFELETDYLSEIGIFGNITSKISYWYYHLPGSSKVILWSDGQFNLAGHPGIRRLLNTMANTFNASILHYDYPNRGESTTPSFPHSSRSLQRDLELSLEKMINILSERFGWSRKQMILGCRCLGCFPTSWIASLQQHGDFGAVIMLTPMVNAEDAFNVGYGMEETVKIPDELNLKLSHTRQETPLLILAADKDEFSSLDKVKGYFEDGGHAENDNSLFVTLLDSTHKRWNEAFVINSLKIFLLGLQVKHRFQPANTEFLISRRFCSEMLGFWDDLAKNPRKYHISYFMESFLGDDIFSKFLLFYSNWCTWMFTTPLAKGMQKILDTWSENLKLFNRNDYCGSFIKTPVILPSREEAGKPFQRPIYEESDSKEETVSRCSFGTNSAGRRVKFCF